MRLPLTLTTTIPSHRRSEVKVAGLKYLGAATWVVLSESLSNQNADTIE